MIVDRLIATLGISTDDKSFKKAGKNIEKLRGILRAATFASSALGVAITASVNSFASEADKMVKHARKINIAVEALQELQFAGERSDISIQTTNTALQRLQRRVSSAARGTGPAVDALAELNLNAQELNQLETDQQLERIIGALSTKPKSEWNRILTALADIEGTEFSKLVEGGLPALRELRKEAKKLDGVFSEKQAKDAEAYQDAMFNLRWALSGIRNLLASEIIPSVTTALSTATKFISENKEGVMFLVKGVGFIVGALSVLMFGKSAVIGGIIGGLLLAFEDIYAFFQGKDSITGLIVDKFKGAFTVVEKAWDAFLDKFKAKWDSIVQSIEDIIPDWMKESWNEAVKVKETIKENAPQAQIAKETGLQAMASNQGKALSSGSWGAAMGAAHMRASQSTVNVAVPVSINGVPAQTVKKEIHTEIMLDNANTARIMSAGEAY